MKILDSTGSVLWRMHRQADTAVSRGAVSGPLHSKLRELHRITTTTMTPAHSNHYAEGRRTLSMYAEGFATTRDFNDALGRSLQNAKMTDESIERLIERMNLTPR
ncbi:MAG: hypothetical protein ACPGTU_06490 [Myxococcota bacterium]